MVNLSGVFYDLESSVFDRTKRAAASPVGMGYFEKLFFGGP